MENWPAIVTQAMSVEPEASSVAGDLIAAAMFDIGVSLCGKFGTARRSSRLEDDGDSERGQLGRKKSCFRAPNNPPVALLAGE